MIGLRKCILLLPLLAVVFGLSGCTKENLDDCFSGLRLQFNFFLHNNEGSLFGEEVNRIRIYLFDEQGVLQLYALDNSRTLEYSFLQNGELKTITKPNPHGCLPEDYIMELEVPPGKYKVIAWGGSAMDTEPTFFHAHMNDPVTHNYQEGVNIGQTRMEDLRMFIKYDIAPDLPEDVVPTVPDIDDLWYGAYGTRNPITSKYTMGEVVIKNGSITDADIELIKNTNVLKITVSGFEYLRGQSSETSPATRGESPLNVWVTAVNGRYLADNSIGEYARSIRYTPKYEYVSDNKMEVDIKILRIDLERHIAQPMYLAIENPLTGETYPAKPIDIVNTLMQAKDAQGNYIYNNQADFDREYEHPVEVRIGIDLQIRIFIRDWEIVNIVPAG